MRIVCLSDTHAQNRKVVVPKGDILIHAVDIEALSIEMVEDFAEWWLGLPHKYKVVIPGNHDLIMMHPVSLEICRDILEGTLLVDEGREIEELRIWGSPWTPVFGDWAFMKPRSQMVKVWEKVPDKVDILVTHGPPFGVLDRTEREWQNVGCESLREVVERVKPKIHVFGHIHEGYGEGRIGDTLCINVSVVNSTYFMENKPVVVDL